MSYNVIQWTTGNVGRYALNGILLHPELNLVGLYAFSQDKLLQDAGELCTYGKPTGIKASNNIDELIALKPDCVCYTANNTFHSNYLEETCRLLEAGINISSTSNVRTCYPKAPFEESLDFEERQPKQNRLAKIIESYLVSHPATAQRVANAQRFSGCFQQNIKACPVLDDE